MTIEQLVSSGELTTRDIDAIMVAAGHLSYELIGDYVDARRAKGRPEAPPSLPKLTIDLLAKEITDRICGCQFHDGGATTLLNADVDLVRMRVDGACVHCPQIIYTIDILKRAMKFRAPEVRCIEVGGTRLDEAVILPENRQMNLALFMKTFGLTFTQLDQALQANGTIDDDDLVRMAGIGIPSRPATAS